MTIGTSVGVAKLEDTEHSGSSLCGNQQEDLTEEGEHDTGIKHLEHIVKLTHNVWHTKETGENDNSGEDHVEHGHHPGSEDIGPDTHESSVEEF
ncbi:hypothetical protein ADUPG1_004582, partial [Aduncisulcus paluster]